MKDLTKYPGKWETCYKMFIKRGGRLTSCMYICDNDLGYSPLFVYSSNTVNVPEFGKFFVFKDLPTWRTLSEISNDPDRRVYRCRGLNLVPAQFRGFTSTSNKNFYLDFWLNKSEVCYTPKDTFYADAIVIDKNVTESVLIWPKD